MDLNFRKDQESVDKKQKQFNEFTNIENYNSCNNIPRKCRLETRCGCTRITYIREFHDIIEIGLSPLVDIGANKTRRFRYCGIDQLKDELIYRELY